MFLNLIVTFSNSTTTQQQTPMTINLNAGQVLLPLVGTAAPQTAQPIVLRCTIPQASLNTNSLSSSTSPISSVTSSSNIIIQQLTAPSGGNVSSVPSLQILQPLLQNIIQQNQSSNIAKVIIMPPTQSKQPNFVPTLGSLLNSTPSYQEPPEPILRIPGYDGILQARKNTTGPTCTVSKPPPSDNSFSNLTISNVFSLKDSDAIAGKTVTWDETIGNEFINIDDDDDDMDQSNDDVPIDDDDDDLVRGDCHQVKAARRAAARIKKATLKFPANEESYCISSECQGDMPIQLRLGDDVEVYETIPEVLTDMELGKYKPKSISTSKILFTSNMANTNYANSQPKNVNHIKKAVVKPPPQKMPRLVPKTKDAPIIISSPTASRNVDDYIVPLPKCMQNDVNKIEATIKVCPIDASAGDDIKSDSKKKTKIKVPQWKVGYVRRRKKKKTSTCSNNSAVPSRISGPISNVSGSISLVSVATRNHSTSKKHKKNSSEYTTIRSLLNAPVGHMVTRRTRSASNSNQQEVIEIDGKSEDSLSRPSSPSNLQGSGAKKQLRMMLLTKSKQDGNTEGDDAVNDCDDLETDAIIKIKSEIHGDEIVPDEEMTNDTDKLLTLEYKGDNIVNDKKLSRNDTDDEFKSEDEMHNLDKISDEAGLSSVGVEKKKSLKVKLCLKTTKRKGRRGRKSRKGKIKSWNITTELEEKGPDKEDHDLSEEGLKDSLPAQDQLTIPDNNPDEVATSGAEEDDSKPTCEASDVGDEKKQKVHKHKRKSKRKRKRKKEEQEKTLIPKDEQSSNKTSPHSPGGREPIPSKLNSGNKISHLKEVLRHQQKQLDELRHRNLEKP